MKNLECYGVQEMNAEEMLEFNGGSWYQDFKDGVAIFIILALILLAIL